MFAGVIETKNIHGLFSERFVVRIDWHVRKGIVGRVAIRQNPENNTSLHRCSTEPHRRTTLG